MEDSLLVQIQTAVTRWAETAYQTREITVGMAAMDDSEDEGAIRYLVDFAVRSNGHWSVAEVWVAAGQILEINDIGEGLPFGDIRWPWPADEI